VQGTYNFVLHHSADDARKKLQLT